MYALILIAISVCFSMKATTINAQTCYFPDGSISPRDTPCRALSYGQASPCCAATDICLDNNYCLAQSGSEVITRGSCTDSTWRRAECPQYCQDGQFHNSMGKARFTLCPCLLWLPSSTWLSTIARIPSMLTLLSSSQCLDECNDTFNQQSR